MASVEDLLQKLKTQANPANLEGMKRYGISTEKRLGASVPFMRQLAKETGKNHTLALQLWDTGYADARILASMVDEPDKVTEQQMDRWVKDIDISF